MDPGRWEKIESLYYSARELATAERAAYLDQACADDVELRDEVMSLLAEAEQPDGFLSKPILTFGLSLLANEQSTSVLEGQLGRYRIIKQLGRGGMGEVYLAVDTRLSRPVALKVLSTFLDRNDLNVLRFEQEARAGSGVSHLNVAHVYEIGEVNGRHYIAMEYVEAETLRALLGRRSLCLREAVAIALQVANALGAAHAAGVIHRDVKPENILVRSDGLVKVVDFGLAKWAAPRRFPSALNALETKAAADVTRTIHTQPGVLMGTANYMSPEQVRGQEVDARADIWSWGIVFYEMLAGRPPFTGATSSDVIAEILKGKPPSLEISVPDSVLVILRRSLSKDKEHRYEAITELLEELRGLSGELERRLDFDSQQDDGVETQNAQLHQHSPGVSPVRRRTETVRRAVSTLGSLSLRRTSRRYLRKDAITRSVSMYAGASGVLAVVLAFAIYDFIGRRAAHTDSSERPQITQLTKDGRVMDAAISRDGRSLAYAPIESGRYGLWVRDLESGEEWRLLAPGDALIWGMRFTPDSQSVLYITTPTDSSVSALMRLPVRGGPSETVVADIAGPPAISPDGAQIAFIRTYPLQHRDVLIVADIGGSAEREIATRHHPDKFSFSGPSWSPDGKLIALGVGRKNDTECAIVAIPVNGGPFIELTAWRWAAVGGVSWHNDGRALIVSARELGTRLLQLWKLSYPGGEMQRIIEDGNAYEEVTLAPGANTIVTTHTYEVSDIWAVDQSGEDRRLTTQGHEGADGLAVTSTGRVIYTVGEYEQSALWSMNMDGSDRRPLTDNGFLPSASRDGRSITYVSTKNGVHHLWLMDADGGNNRQLTHGQGEFSPSITPDGSWIVYASLAGERSSLWKVSTGDGEFVQLNSTLIVRRPVVSPDGKMIACAYRLSERDEWRIGVLSFDRGTLLKTFALPFPRNQMIRWTLDGRALVYLEKRDGVHNLWRQPLDGSGASQITHFTEDLILHHDSVDERREIVLSRGGRRRDIAVVTNFK